MTEPPATPTEQEAVARDLAAIVARYGDRLDDDARATVAARLLELRHVAAAIRAVPLTAADEPRPGFAPRRARDDA